MPVGDSITAGYRSDSGNGYRGPLYSELINQGNVLDIVGSQTSGSMFDPCNEGYYGYRIDQIASLINGELALYQPNVVLLDIGVNDLAQNYEVSTAPNRLASLIDQIIAADPSVTVLVAQLGPNSTASVQSLINSYNNQIPGIVQTRASSGEHVYMVSMTSLTLADLSDGLHPNDIGYQLMANIWDAGIQQVIADGWIANISFGGVFQITCESGAGQALSVSGASTTNAAAIVQDPYQDAWNQQWDFIPTSNGYYQIKNMNSQEVLNVTGGSQTEDALIVQWPFGTAENQQWLPVLQADGSYMFYNLNSGMVLDDPGFNTTEGEQYQQYPANGGSNQKFSLTQLTGLQPAAALATGTYSLIVHSTGMSLNAQGGGTGNQTPLIQYPYSGAGNELWNVVAVGNGLYYALGVASGRALTVANGSESSGAAAQLYDYSSSTDQLFTLQASATSGYYNVIFVNSGLGMSVSGGSTTADADIVQEPVDIGATDAEWQFQPQPSELATGTYAILAQSTGMSLAPQNGATASLTDLVQSPYNGASDELWNVTWLGNGEYSATGVQSGLSLNVDYASTGSGAQIILYPYNGASNELFTLVAQGDGYYNVDFVNSTLAMSVSGASTNAGALIVQNPPSTQSNEEWTFQPAPFVPTGTYAIIVNSTGMSLTAQGGATASETPLVQSPYTGATSQLWNVTWQGNGQYSAVGVQSGLSINVPSNSTAGGTGLILYAYDGSSNELFTLANQVGGYYNIIFDISGLAMSIYDASTTSGADVIQEYYEGDPTDAQWTFQPESP